MDARRTQRTTASRGDRRHKAHKAWILAILALAALVQACTDNNGKSPGPTFPSGTTGFASTGADLTVQVAVNPNTIQPGRVAGVTVLVINNNGRGVPGKHVQLSTSWGTLSVVDGFTDLDGKFVSFLKITEADAAVTTSGTVTAFVEGQTGSAEVTSGAPPTAPTAPALVILPATATRTQGASGAAPGTCNFAVFNAQFVVTGGTPPFTFSVAGGIGGTISATGLYSGPAAAVAGGFNASDTVIVVDSAGVSATATVTLTCTAVAP